MRQHRQLSLSSRGLGPAKTSVFVGGCRPRDPGNINYILFVIPWLDHGTQVINALCASTDNFPCHPVARAPRKRQFSWVDADHGTQVIRLVAQRHHICTLLFEKPRHKPTPTYSVHHINPSTLDYIFLSNLFSNFVSTLSVAFRAE